MMIDNIKSILSTKQSVDQSADMFRNLSIKENTAEYDFDVGHLINPNSSQKVITDERSGFVNSYDRVIRRTDKETKLCPNRFQLFLSKHSNQHTLQPHFNMIVHCMNLV